MSALALASPLRIAKHGSLSLNLMSATCHRCIDFLSIPSAIARIALHGAAGHPAQVRAVCVTVTGRSLHACLQTPMSDGQLFHKQPALSAADLPAAPGSTLRAHLAALAYRHKGFA